MKVNDELNPQHLLVSGTAGNRSIGMCQRCGPGGMIGAMMKGDVSGDGILQAAEISPELRPMLKRVDTNGDGSLDQKELEAMAKAFAERRKNSQASSRDPIVYGVAAIPEVIIVRT